MSGFAVAGALLGQPDIGLVTASEMTERARQIVSMARGRPVIADGDNGYGGEFNVARLVAGYESAGVSCIQLEDQVSPKRCGHMENKTVVDKAQAVSHVRMAVESRRSNEFLIMARTDARATHDLEEALDRGEAFLAAGADILFVESPATVEEMHTIARHFPNVPLVANMVEDGKTPELSPAALYDMGLRIILRPVSALLAMSRYLQHVYADLVSNGQLDQSRERLTFGDYNQMVGLDEYIKRGL